MTGFTFDMTQTAIIRTKVLTLSGALPFVGALALVFFPIPSLDAAQLALTYGALIIAFVAGTQWGLFLTFSQRSPIDLMIHSNIVTLIAWMGLLFSPVAIALALQGLCFLYLLYLDRRLLLSGIIPQWYFSLRRLVTAIVVVTLLALIIALLLT